MPSAAFLRSEGKCPLAPEEAVLMLAAIGFKHRTSIYIAGAEIYGGRHRMAAISRLYPAIVTKETLLSPSELAPFRNFSSQVTFDKMFYLIPYIGRKLCKHNVVRHGCKSFISKDAS